MIGWQRYSSSNSSDSWVCIICILVATKYNILHCACMKGMLVFAMCHYNYISSWEVSFCCGCRQQGPPARVVFFYSGKKIAIFKCKNVFSIGYVKQLAIWMHPSNACLLSLTKTKRQTLLKPGHCLGDPFCCACTRSNDVFFQLLICPQSK